MVLAPLHDAINDNFLPTLVGGNITEQEKSPCLREFTGPAPLHSHLLHHRVSLGAMSPQIKGDKAVLHAYEASVYGWMYFPSLSLSDDESTAAIVPGCQYQWHGYQTTLQSMAATHPSHLGLLYINSRIPPQYLLMLVMKVFHRHMFSRNCYVSLERCRPQWKSVEIITEEYDTMEVSNCYKQVRPH